MTQQQGTVPDPMAMWREWVSQSERQWNAALNQAMATDEFSQTMGKFMDVYLNMQKSMNEAMGRYLQALNVPSRTDIMELGDRLSSIEDRLTGIEVALSKRAAAPANGAKTEGTATAAPRRKPARTKKPG